MSESMSPATRTPESGRNTAACPGAWPSWMTTRAAGPSQGMRSGPSGSATRRPNRARSWPGRGLLDSADRPALSAAMRHARGAAYRGTSPRSRSTARDPSADGSRSRPAAAAPRRPDRRPARPGRRPMTAGSMTRQPPSPAVTTVLVVTAYSAVVTRTPGAISRRRCIAPFYRPAPGLATGFSGRPGDYPADGNGWARTGFQRHRGRGSPAHHHRSRGARPQLHRLRAPAARADRRARRAGRPHSARPWRRTPAYQAVCYRCASRLRPSEHAARRRSGRCPGHRERARRGDPPGAGAADAAGGAMGENPQKAELTTKSGAQGQ